jgi:hypothetical protein
MFQKNQKYIQTTIVNGGQELYCKKKNTLAAITVGGRGNFWERNHLTRQGTYHVRMAIPCTYRIYKLTKFIKNLKNHTYSFDPPLFFVYKFQLRNLSNE